MKHIPTALFILTLLLLTTNCSTHDRLLNVTRSRIQTAPQIDGQWDPDGNLLISEEAVKAGGYAKLQCEPITVPICNGAFYEYTRMPNILNHETQEEAGLEAHQFYPLIHINCSKDLHFFICSIYTPICMEGFPQSLPPCRSVCERAKAGCGPIMGYYAFTWPDRMSCDQFPELNNPEGSLCMERNLTEGMEGATGPADAVSAPTRTLEVEPKGLTSKRPGAVQMRMSERLEWAVRRTDPNPALLAGHPEARLVCECNCRQPLVAVMAFNDSQLAQISTLNLHSCALPCHSIHFQTEGDRKFVHFWLWLWSLLCALSTLITVFTYLTNPSRFQYPGQPIVYVSACYFFVALGYIIRMTLGHESVACTQVPQLPQSLGSVQEALTSGAPGTVSILQFSISGQAGCATVFLLTFYFGMASSVWWVVLTITWYLAAGMKWGNEAISKYTQVFHFVSWILPGIQTGVVVMLRAVDGDPIGGLCTVGSTSDTNLTYHLLLPLCLYLCVGTFFLLAGFVALCRIRQVIKYQPRTRTDKLEKLMIKLGIFGILYTVPAVVVISCLAYELRWREYWQLGVACKCDWRAGEDGRILPVPWSLPTPEYSVFMLKYFMSLIVGITSGFWIWSGKTLTSWRQFFTKEKLPAAARPASAEKPGWSAAMSPHIQSPPQFSLKRMNHEEGTRSTGKPQSKLPPPLPTPQSLSSHSNFYDSAVDNSALFWNGPVVRTTSSGIGGSGTIGMGGGGSSTYGNRAMSAARDSFDTSAAVNGAFVFGDINGRPDNGTGGGAIF